MRMRTLLTALATVTTAIGGLALAGPAGASPTAATFADPSKAPGGNFDLSVWQLQEPVGSPGKPTTIPSSRLQGANGFQDDYFYTDKRDGAMTFWAPEKGVTTPNSNYARSELREMNRNGGAADWSLGGSHKLRATLRVVSVTKNVCVGQIHLGSGGSSTKPLVELYYRANGDIVLGTENSPDGGQTLHNVGHVSVGKTWNYTIAVSGGDTIDLTVNGSTTHYDIPSSFFPYKQYFKAGSYNQSSSDSTTNGARVGFYGLTVSHD
ncbi:polysaccharide lyase family 7 protein [Streptomyces rugosispiralis]|uniref:Polysaccharide lyase family 7 protein n=1 Tax=Streptomyces rugosispiralis TaxID=2967341 RepID=A0ABT1VB50_9ACTN|nr:polysaccharide lyase family 7 protein [Streptomyces rugosispiralis]MCQ8194511.1 polysaccharide lyase family 7 protein [Streptomyces rugosispiralis]